MSRRAAFTLVELLVVAGIFAMLFGLVLNGARPSATGQVKQAAQSIASVLLATQSKALGQSVGAGVIFDPGASGTMVTSLSAADMLPLITGACTNGMPPASLFATSGTVAITPDNADSSDLSHGYKIRFQKTDAPLQAPTDWMNYSYSNTSGTVSFRWGNGQTDRNTIWPTASGTYTVSIARYPAEGQTLYELPKAAAIDLRYSGIGEDPNTAWEPNGRTWDVINDPANADVTTPKNSKSKLYFENYGGLAQKGAIAITFDSVGGVDGLMQRVLPTDGVRRVQPLAPTQPIYLLVAERAAVESGANPLASNTSLWVAIHPQTGRVSVSSNVPQTSTDALALRNARANARAGLAIGK